MKEKQKTNIVSNLPDVNQRVFDLVQLKTNGNVTKFAELIGKNQQGIDRLFRIDKRSNSYPKVSDAIIEAIVERFLVNKAWLLLGEGESGVEFDVLERIKSIDLPKQMSLEEKLNYLIKSDNLNRIYIKTILVHLGLEMEKFKPLEEELDKIIKTVTN